MHPSEPITHFAKGLLCRHWDSKLKAHARQDKPCVQPLDGWTATSFNSIERAGPCHSADVLTLKEPEVDASPDGPENDALEMDCCRLLAVAPAWHGTAMSAPGCAVPFCAQCSHTWQGCQQHCGHSQDSQHFHCHAC